MQGCRIKVVKCNSCRMTFTQTEIAHGRIWVSQKNVPGTFFDETYLNIRLVPGMTRISSY